MFRQVIAVLVLVLALAALLIYSQWRPVTRKVSGFIEAHQVRIGSRVGGRVLKVHFEEGDEVRTGDVIVELEPYDLFERRAQAMAELAAARQEHAKLEAGYRPEEIAQAKAKVDQLAAMLDELINGPREEEIAAAQGHVQVAEAQLRQAELDLAKIKMLFDRQSATQEELDRVATQVEAAQGEVQVAQQKLAALKAGTRKEQIAQMKAQVEEATQAWEQTRRGYREEEKAAAKAAVDGADAVVRALDIQISELTIRASVDGVIDALDLRPGDMVGASAPVLSLQDKSQLWVRAYVPEGDLDVKIGQKLAVTVDAFPNKRFAGHISFVSREGEFTPRNVQTPEERSKQVFRIKVMLDEGIDVLRPGMSADVWLDSGVD